jgi:hypothetical protein
LGPPSLLTSLRYPLLTQQPFCPFSLLRKTATILRPSDSSPYPFLPVLRSGPQPGCHSPYICIISSSPILLVYLEDGGSRFLRNVSEHLSGYPVSHKKAVTFQLRDYYVGAEVLTAVVINSTFWDITPFRKNTTTPS